MTAANDHALRRNLARMLEQLGRDEYRAQLSAHKRAGRVARTLRYAPSAFHIEAVRILGYGSSEDVARTIHAYELENYSAPFGGVSYGLRETTY